MKHIIGLLAIVGGIFYLVNVQIGDPKIIEKPVIKETVKEVPRYTERIVEKPVIVEKVVEKPVERIVEKPTIVEKRVEVPKIVEVPKYIEKPRRQAKIDDRPPLVIDEGVHHYVAIRNRPNEITYRCTHCGKMMGMRRAD